MIDWQPLKIRDLGRVVTGKTPPTESTEYYDGDELFVSPKDLTWNSYYVDSTATRISDKALDKFKGQVIPRDAVMFTSLSFAFGKMGIASRSCITNQQINSIIVNDRHCARYVYYLLRAYEPYIFAYNSGIDTPIVPKSVFERIPVLVPGKAEQEKIASLLSSYDDLIANHQRRCALLEAMAEEVYREWFVRMRFPGAGSALSAHGVPRGWRPGTLSELAVESGVPTTAGRHLEGRLYCPLDALARRRMVPETHYEWDQAQSSLITFNKSEILFGAMRPYQHKVSIAPFDGVTRTTAFVLRPRQPEYFSYLFLTLFQSSSVDFASQICNGSDRPYAVWSRGFERLPVWIPDVELAQRFNELVRPMLDSLIETYFLLRSLAKQRDALLPRLISGKFRVDALDIQFPPSMQQPPEESAQQAQIAS